MEEYPLKGKHVLMTRGGEQGETFCHEVATAGGIPYMIPLIDFRPYQDLNAAHFIQSFDLYDWIIFTSRNGVKYFFRHIEPYRESFELLKEHIRFAAVGEKTEAELKRYHIRAQFVPSVYTADDFGREFFQNGLTAKRVLIPKGNLAKKTIAEWFRNRGIIADEWIVYETFYPTKDTDRLVQILREDRLDAACFTSPSAFHHFMKVTKQYYLHEHAGKLKLASIGKVTKKAIEEEGFTVHICPGTFTIDAMFKELCRFFGKRERKNRNGSHSI
jgi:uroporphyrinogen-III synthase